MFSVLWSNGDTSNIVDSIALGTYYVDVYNQTSGCHATDSHTVSFYDNVIPNVIAKNDTIYLDSNGNALVHVQDIDNGSFDNCHIDSLYLTQQNFNCNHANTTTLYLKASGGATWVHTRYPDDIQFPDGVDIYPGTNGGFNLGLGGGAKFRLSKRSALSVEFMGHFLYSDLIEGFKYRKGFDASDGYGGLRIGYHILLL